MKKAIGALVSGLLLSAFSVAVYRAFRDRNVLNRAGRQSSGLLDLNQCSIEDLAALAGIDSDVAERILENRPYRNKLDLVSRMVVPEATYIQFSQFVTASDPDAPIKVA